MLFYSASPGAEGSELNLRNAPDGITPPDYHGMTPAAHVGYLRAAYYRNPRPFLELVRDARDKDLTLVSAADLVGVLYRALVGFALRRGWDIAGGPVASAPPRNVTGRYTTSATS